MVLGRHFVWRAIGRQPAVTRLNIVISSSIPAQIQNDRRPQGRTMGRYQRSNRLPPFQSSRKERLKYGLLTSLAIIFLYRMHHAAVNYGDEDILIRSGEVRHDDAEYHSIRKAVPQDYDQPEKSMGDYSVNRRHHEDKARKKVVDLLVFQAAEPHQISDYARELLPTWAQLYFKWYREQPIDSSYQLVVTDLNYLDAAVYAAAQMNRLLKLDIDETAMVVTSLLALDWKLQPNMPSRRIRTLNAWDERDANDSIVFGSTEFLQSVTLATANDPSLSVSWFGPLWHSVFQPSPLLQLLRTNLDQSTLTAGHFVAVHCRAGSSGHADDDAEALFLKAKRGVQCGQWALKQAHQDYVDVYFMSNNEQLNDRVRGQGIDLLLSPSGLERIVVPESAYQSRFPQLATNGKSVHDGWWIDLYTAIVARCIVYGEGDFGEIASKIANTDCQVRHEETNFGTAPLCPPDL
jgi:hypothetical protein